VRRILVVDDDPAVLKLLRRSLEREAWLVAVSRSGSEALKILATVEFDVIVTDLELGHGPTGLDIIKQRPLLNRDKRYVILTGYGTQARCREALLSGAVDFLDKPFRMSTLLEALEPQVVTAPLSARREAADGLSPAPRQGVRHVQAAIREIERRYSDQRLNVEGIADSLDISREHLCREFRRQLTKSPLQYLHDIRVTHAKQLLLTTNLSVYAIARDCGYHDTSELDRHFRVRCGFTPTGFVATRTRTQLAHQDSATNLTIRQSIDIEESVRSGHDLFARTAGSVPTREG
jgi:two-component system, response regulator YesN